MVDKVEDLVVPSASELGIGTTPSKESGRTSEKNVGSTVEQITTRVKETFSEVMARLQQTIIGTEAEAVFELSAPPGGIFTPNPDASLVKDKKQDARNVLKEWFFAVIPKQLAVNAQLIENIEYLKEHMVLMPAELVIFEESLIALRALQEVQEQLFQKLTKYSQEEFLNKPEEEQLQIILDLYNSEYQESIRKAIFPVFKVVLHLDKIFALHRSELENRTDREKFRLLEKESDFVMSARIAQGLARLDLLASAWVKELEPSLALESQILRERLQKNIEYTNELNRINILCYKDNSNIPKDSSSRSDFMQDEKAEAFLSFLEKRDPQKVVYFKLLQRFSKEGVGVLKSKNLKKILPFIAEDLNKLLRPVQGGNDFYLVRLNSGENLTEEAKIKAREDNTPILARMGAHHVIYGRRNGEWTTLDLDFLTQDERSVLDLLDFNSPMLKSVDIPEILVNVLKKGHALSEIEKAEKKQRDQQQQQEDMALAFNTIESLLFDVLEPEFADFTKQLESLPPSENEGLVLTDENNISSITAVTDMPSVVTNATQKAFSHITSTFEMLKDRFSKPRKTPDFRGEISFDQFMQVVEQQVKLFQNLAAEATYQDDPRVRGWELRNPELSSDINETTTQKMAAKELYHNDALVCDFTPQNEGMGTGVTVYNHTNDNIDLVVRLMIETLAQEGKKEVCISMVIDSPEAEELALRYASTILRQGAIPILLGENGEELTAEETKDKLRTMLGSTNNLSAKHRVLLERYELAVERLEKAKEEDQKFLVEFEKFISEPILTSKSKMQDPRDSKKKLSKEEILLRLAEIALTNHNMTAKEFVNDIVDYMARISLSPFVSKTEMKKRLVERLLTLLTTNPNQSPEMLIEKIFAEAAKEFSLTAKISISNREDTLEQQRQKEQDDNFLKEFNYALSQLKSSVTYKALVMKDTNGNRLSEQKILEEFVKVALIREKMDKAVFVDKIIDLALASSSNAAGVFFLSEDRDILHNILLKRCEFFLDFRTNTIEKFTAELIEIARVYCAERQGIVIPVVNESVISAAENSVTSAPAQNLDLSSITSNDREVLSTTLSGFNQRVKILFDKKAEVKMGRRFERALGAYALFHEAIRQKRFDLAKSLMSDVAFLIEDAELMLKADEAQHSVKERTYVREIYNSLLQKASAELELDLDRQSAVASTESQESLESFARNILVRDLQGQQLIEELLKEPAETTSSDEALERFLRESEPKEPSSSSQNVELTDEDRDYLAYLDDLTFMEVFDSLLQKATLAVGNHTVSMQDPNTGEDLNELQILVRLATMALVDKTMTEEDFLERIITFAFVSPKLASNVSLTPQKTEELKKELRSKFQGKEIDPAHIDELVSKLVKIARHEYSKGHTADEITGQHRDLYAPAKTTTVLSHHDDDGEGEARAPAMSHTH